MNRKRVTKTGWLLILVLGGVCLLYVVSFAPAKANSPLAITLVTVAGRAEGNTATLSKKTRTEGEPPPVAQVTETPAAYPGPGEQATPADTATPGAPTQVPENGYPAGVDVDGTDRVGGDNGPLLGNQSGQDETAGSGGAARIEQKGLGSFILWVGFIFGLTIFVAGVLVSIFLSARSRHTDL
ncbi:MAG: hypothetical protein R3248_09580 [Candidatus Promineifilaceae bacterium]|nr:hypothetical protein [Candidatus Promineifilaceae bacterium]